MRNPAEAVNYAQRAIELDPKNSLHRSNLGVALYRDGQWQAAVDALEQAHMMRKGGDLEHRCFLAMACWQLNERKKALACYQEAIAYLRSKKSGNQQLRRFCDEAKQVLEISTKDMTDIHKSGR